MSASETKWVRLGEYIEQSDKRNSDGALTETDVQGISTDKCFIPTKANLDGVSVLSYLSSTYKCNFLGADNKQ